MMTANHQSSTQAPYITRLCMMSDRTRDSQSRQSIIFAVAYLGITRSGFVVSLWEENGMRMIYQIF